MIHFPIAWLTILATPEPIPRPDPVPEDLDPDLLLRRMFGEEPPPMALPPLDLRQREDWPEAPYTTPPNRAQRRAQRKRR